MKNFVSSTLELVDQLKTPYTVLLSIFFLVFLSTAVLKGIHNIESDFNKVVLSAKNSVMIGEATSHIRDTQMSHELYLSTASKSHLDHYEFMRDVVASTLSLLNVSYKDNEAQKYRVQELRRLVGEESEEMRRMVSVLRASGYQAGQDIHETEELVSVRNQMRATLKKMQDEEGLQLEAMGLQAAKAVRYTLMNIYMVVAAVVITATILVRYLRQESVGRSVIAEERAAQTRNLRGRITQLETETLRVKDLMENAPVAVLSMNASGHVIYSNKKVSELLGYASADIEGRHISTLLDFHSQKDYNKYLHNFSQMGDKERERKGVQEVLGKDIGDNVFPMEITLTSSDVGGVTIFVASLRNVQEIHDLKVEVSRLQGEEGEGAAAQLKSVDKAVVN